MEHYSTTPPDKDPNLWEIARKRASFKSHLITYLVVNAFLWALWFFSHGHDRADQWPWPLWPTLGWGVGIVFNYFGAYVYPEVNSAEREYEKLKRKQ
ncbi:MAG: 2TM domain-containing protein [Chitinophagaceae bacterium]|nr:2TM domain-containing protein [Chitinophagaceae bacterium]